MKVKALSLFAMVFAALSLLTGCAKEPVAFFSVSNAVGLNQDVTFINYSVDADSYTWDFGDGTSSTEREPTHQYTAEGTYSVTLTAYSKGEKKKDSATKTVTVDALQAFVGNYNVTQDCNGSGGFYTMSVFSNGFQLFIQGLDNQFANFQCDVSGNSFTMFPQFFNGFEYNATGTLNGNTLTIAFSKNDGVTTTNCNATAIKQ